MTTRASDTASTLASVSGSGEASRPDEVTITSARPVHPYLHVIVVALVGAVSVLAWLIVYQVVTKLLWENDVVVANPWLAPAICLPFSLLVGLLVKYRRAPTTLDESMLDSLSGDTSRIDWRGLPVNVLMAWASLFSGAVLGPEGGIGGIATKISAFYSEKVGIPAEHRPLIVFSTLASAYNGLLANPLFTGVLATEVIKDPDTRARTLPADLLGGAIGYLVFLAAGSVGLQDFLHLSPTQPFAPVDVVLAGLLGLLGLVLGLIAGALFRVSAAIFGRLEGREVERALLAGVIFSAVGIVAPILLFAGETQVHDVVADPAKYGPAILVAMALLKLALLAVAFKSGFLGGPTFPAIFASVCLAEAIGLLLPGIRIDVLVAGVMAGFLMVLFRTPFMVVLLTAVMLQAGPELLALIVLSVAAVMIVQPYILAAIARRQAAGNARRGMPADGGAGA